MAASQRRLVSKEVGRLSRLCYLCFPVGLNFNDMPRKLLRNSLGLIRGAAARSHPELSGYRRFVTAASRRPTHSMYILRWYIGDLKMSNINFRHRDIAAWDRLSHPDDSRSFATCAFRRLTCGVQNDHTGDVSAPNRPAANTAGRFLLEEYRVIGRDLRTSSQAACRPNCDGEFWGDRKHPDHEFGSSCLFWRRQTRFWALNSCVAQWVFSSKIQKCGSKVQLLTRVPALKMAVMHWNLLSPSFDFKLHHLRPFYEKLFLHLSWQIGPFLTSCIGN